MIQATLFNEPEPFDYLPGKPIDPAARYSVGTFDCDEGGFTIDNPAWVNIRLWELREVIRYIRSLGYESRGKRREGFPREHEGHNDFWLIERTDDKSVEQILAGWKR